MRFFERFSRGELRLNRLEAFSDGVFAIIVTLLVLELQVPELKNHESAKELAKALWALFPKFFSWLISFIIVCKFWLNHHHVLGLARYANYGLVWLNSIFLLCQSFVPFPTALMGEYPNNPLAVSFLGCVMAFNTLVFITMQAYIVRNLIRPEVAATQDPHFFRKGLIGPLSYLIGAGGAWISVYIGFVMYVITPLFYLVPPSTDTDTNIDVET
jgi:uncharacterized membrane protein